MNTPTLPFAQKTSLFSVCLSLLVTAFIAVAVFALPSVQAAPVDDAMAAFLNQQKAKTETLEAKDDAGKQAKELSLQHLEEQTEKTKLVMDDTVETRKACVGCLQYTAEDTFVDMLIKGEISKVEVIYITPQPLTPLCNQPGTAGDESFHPVNRGQVDITETVTRRTDSVRRLLAYAKSNPGQMTLHFVHTQKGYTERTEQQQGIFNAISEAGDCQNIIFNAIKEEIPPEMVGASYWVTATDGQQFLWSLTGKQAIQEIDSSQQAWTIYFGRLDDPTIKARSEGIKDFYGKAVPGQGSD
ncbi:hypothetical protein [Endozoicomonas sp. Mp262]|uniref:hypothetical protein n=1 Tax=Endozoicomonas sp. Mp262 TaxID=2919499 RepID=UPI0021DA8873